MSDLEDDLNEALDERDEALRLLSEEQELRKRAEREVTEIRQVLINMLVTLPPAWIEEARQEAYKRERERRMTYDQYASIIRQKPSYSFKDIVAP